MNALRRFVSAVTACCVLMIAACHYVADAEEAADAGKTMPDVPPAIARDLELEAKLITPAEMGPGEPIGLALALVNRSKTKTYSVVQPGDGSEVGWREPHVFFTAQRRAGDKWVDVPRNNYGRCGLFDSDWHDDVVELAPLEKLVLKDWLASPDAMLEFQEAGAYRLLVHYRYRAGSAGKGKRAEPTDVGRMKDTPAFEVVSEPITLTLTRPLELRVKARGPLRVKTKRKLSDVLEIRLVNLTDKPQELSSPTAAQLHFELRGEFGGWRPLLDERESSENVEQQLPPGESIELLGDGAFAGGLNGEWEYPVAEDVEIRAVYYRPKSGSEGVIKSEWVEVGIED